MLKGRFIIKTPKKEIILPNLIVDEGLESFLKMMLQAATGDVSAGGNFYVGICGTSAPQTDWDLTDIAGEPSSAGGYSRQAVTRDATGWPTVSAVNSLWRARTADVTFAASGADFDATLNRLFLCNASSGTSGVLFAVSAALTTPITIANGESYPTAYEIYADG